MSRPAVNSRLHRFVVVTIISAMVTVGLTAFGAVYFYKDLVRYVYMERIYSEDPATRARGLNYMARRLLELPEEDPLRQRIADHARRILKRSDDVTFAHLVAALHEVGEWGRDFDPPSWVRYLTSGIERRTPSRKVTTAIELGKVLWHGMASPEDARVVAAVEALLADEDAEVRLNTLSTAARLQGAERERLIEGRLSDPEAEIAKHAHIMLALLNADRAQQAVDKVDAAAIKDYAQHVRPAYEMAMAWTKGETAVAPVAPPEGASEAVIELARLEAAPTNSLDVAIEDRMPHLVRLQAVRASTRSQPRDLMAVFNAEQPSTRDLACLVAIERFSAEECRELAKDLIGSFDDAHRMAGPVLAGMISTDHKLQEMLEVRRSQDHLGWVVHRHYLLGATMAGETVTQTVTENGLSRQEPFDPGLLLGQREMPRTTVTMGLLHQGDLQGVDYYINPFGEPPVALELMFDQLRWWPVLRRYLPDMPPFWVWADTDTQKRQLDILRDWYLLFRPALRFDTTGHVFRLQRSGSV